MLDTTVCTANQMCDGVAASCYSWFVIGMIDAIVAAFAVFFRSRVDLSLELLALR